MNNNENTESQAHDSRNKALFHCRECRFHWLVSGTWGPDYIVSKNKVERDFIIDSDDPVGKLKCPKCGSAEAEVE